MVQCDPLARKLSSAIVHGQLCSSFVCFARLDVDPSHMNDVDLSLTPCLHVKSFAAQVDAQYRAINRQRNAEASTKTRLMKIIDDPRSMLALRPGSQVSKRRVRRLAGLLWPQFRNITLFIPIVIKLSYNKHDIAHLEDCRSL